MLTQGRVLSRQDLGSPPAMLQQAWRKTDGKDNLPVLSFISLKGNNAVPHPLITGRVLQAPPPGYFSQLK